MTVPSPHQHDTEHEPAPSPTHQTSPAGSPAPPDLRRTTDNPTDPVRTTDAGRTTPSSPRHQAAGAPERHHLMNTHPTPTTYSHELVVSDQTFLLARSLTPEDRWLITSVFNEHPIVTADELTEWGYRPTLNATIHRLRVLRLRGILTSTLTRDTHPISPTNPWRWTLGPQGRILVAFYNLLTAPDDELFDEDATQTDTSEDTDS